MSVDEPDMHLAGFLHLTSVTIGVGGKARLHSSRLCRNSCDVRVYDQRIVTAGPVFVKATPLRCPQVASDGAS